MTSMQKPDAAQAPVITPDAIMQLGSGYWASKTLLSAVELGLFTSLASGPLVAEEIGRRHQLHPRSLRDFLDALVALGMLDRSDGLYSNTPATGLFLDRTKPTYLGGILEMFNARLYGFWGDLTEGLKTGEPQNEAKTGGDLFDALYQDPVELQRFLAAMTGSEPRRRPGHRRRNSPGRTTRPSSMSAAPKAASPSQSPPPIRT